MHGEDVPLPEDRVVEPRRQLDFPRPQGVGFAVVVEGVRTPRLYFFGIQ
jgi:hypothetical protein